MEEEIAASLTIENIDFNRDSVRKILNGYAPQDESEARIYMIKIKPKSDYPLKTLYPRAFQTGQNHLIYYDFTTVE